jgi:hypothetical protein
MSIQSYAIAMHTATQVQWYLWDQYTEDRPDSPFYGVAMLTVSLTVDGVNTREIPRAEFSAVDVMHTVHGLDLAGRFINTSAWGAPEMALVMHVNADGSAEVKTPRREGGSYYWTCPASTVAHGSRNMLPTPEDSARWAAEDFEDATRAAERNGF